ncbi:MAG: hypothetical protein HYX24_04200 [Candidatus Aenigmarchaeota archaeon]|nr:hypothetical protein [Candidatus Aenigmarchaeota archaeon]
MAEKIRTRKDLEGDVIELAGIMGDWFHLDYRNLGIRLPKPVSSEKYRLWNRIKHMAGRLGYDSIKPGLKPDVRRDEIIYDPRIEYALGKEKFVGSRGLDLGVSWLPQRRVIYNDELSKEVSRPYMGGIIAAWFREKIKDDEDPTTTTFFSGLGYRAAAERLDEDLLITSPASLENIAATISDSARRFEKAYEETLEKDRKRETVIDFDPWNLQGPGSVSTQIGSRSYGVNGWLLGVRKYCEYLALSCIETVDYATGFIAAGTCFEEAKKDTKLIFREEEELSKAYRLKMIREEVTKQLDRSVGKKFLNLLIRHGLQHGISD